MDKSKSSQLDKAIEESERLSELETLRRQKRENYLKKIRLAPSTFHKMMIYMGHQWLNIILLSIATIGSAIVLGFIAKTIWELWLMIFSL